MITNFGTQKILSAFYSCQKLSDKDSVEKSIMSKGLKCGKWNIKQAPSVILPNSICITGMEGLTAVDDNVLCSSYTDEAHYTVLYF